MNTYYETTYQSVNSDEFKKIQDAPYDKNGDATVNGVKYRRINSEDGFTSGSSLYNYNGSYLDSSYHYFKYEPIKWRILHTDGKKAFLLADIVLDNQRYNSNSMSVTWETSTLRSWLNGHDASANEYGTDYSSKNFIDFAFSSEERNAIQKNSVTKNSIADGTTTTQNTTLDQIFLLSESEVYSGDETTSYGFSTASDSYDEAKRSLCSTYAFAMGVSRYDTKDYPDTVNWWIRPLNNKDSSDTSYVNASGVIGSMSVYGIGPGNKNGVRPALYLNLSSTNLYSYAGTVCSSTSDASDKNNYIDSATITYHYSASDDTRKEYHFPYSDYMFYINDQKIRYGKAMAQASLSAAMAGFSDCRTDSKFTETLDTDDESRAANIRELYQNLKFSDAKFYNYEKALSDSSDKAAFSIAKKYINKGETINDTSQGEDTVLAIVVRGGRYGAEWASNFNVVNGTDYGKNHYGFSTAAREIESKVNQYVKELKQTTKGIQGNLKIWITGYSRGSAVANQVAHDLMADGIDGTTIQTNDMYAYTFATPNVGYTNRSDISYRKYPRDEGIFNIVSPLDVVPKVPLSKWNYGKYGHTLYLPTDNYASLWSKYSDLSGKRLTGSNTPISTYQKSIVSALESMAALIAPDQVAYRATLQDSLWTLFKIKNQEASSIKDSIKNNIMLAYEALLDANPSSNSLLAAYLEDAKNGSSVFTNLGRAHEPEYYMSRIELDNLENKEGFQDNQIIKQASITLKSPNTRATTKSNETEVDLSGLQLEVKNKAGTVVCGIKNNTAYSSHSVSCDTTGNVTSRKSESEIFINSNKIEIFFYNNDYTITIVSGADRVADLVVTELDEDLNPSRTVTHNDVELVAKKTYALRITDGTQQKYTMVLVKPDTIKVKKIRLTGISKKIAAGKKITLHATVLPGNASNQKLLWKSGNKKIATVNSRGVVTLKRKTGGKKVVITATAADGSKVKTSFTITSMKGIVKKVKITGSKTVKAGKKLKLKAKVTATKKANKKLLWTSGNTKYATVNARGIVTTKKSAKGKTVKITAMATDGSGKKNTVKIKIK